MTTENHYLIMYNDGTSLNVMLTNEQLKSLFIALGQVSNEPAVLFNGIGILVLQDVRSVIYVPPVPEENPSYDPELTDEQQEYIRVMKLAEMALAEGPADDEHDDESDYEGGPMV